MNFQPITLEGTQVTLLPMQESHISALVEAASDPAIFAYMTPLLQPSAVEQFVRQALDEQKAGLGIPFSVYDKHSDSFVGSTRLFDYSIANRHVEIGHTWYNPRVWRTRINTECKYLLLRHCFETLDLLRVQLKTDLRNERSQAAIARIGAQKEGTLRQHRVLHDGYVRDTVMFSIIDREWVDVKQRLEGFLNRVNV
ncbi:GNAT family N-acetyltransferase [Paenibacillus sp. CGMCC 1.16610]|uniref:GNAT family N-acetyltransferase n=1 Tax=Paenibacillus anseongense TaxID=2682845 RepID=A0ABW9UKW6_9BACL|nr:MULTISPECIES: GNAT family protein [Paenibacillus]MBA2938518.1 GNAT family N-acetyltransferase [Paenibacillus sp. CGMCC 1.16610]MVQ39636.1 GNAT family N-acetyltransferase [Paenibacillus anseongense]